MNEQLKAKLREILNSMWVAGLDWATSEDFDDLEGEERDKVYLTYQTNKSSECIAQIDQAYKEAGYASRTERVVQIPPITWPPKQACMTGQEWYDKFEVGLTHTARWKKLPDDAYPRTQNDVPITIGELLAVARKAAGIK